jgi:carbonic anhydrase/acetyltransferase-like protein (isoleucine patch superfamily)
MWWSLFDKGLSMSTTRGETRGQRLAAWWGSYQARRHRTVTVPSSCRIHPEARIHPRSGAIRLGERCLIAPGAVVQGNVVIGGDCSVQAYAVLVGYGTLDEPSGLITIGQGCGSLHM